MFVTFHRAVCPDGFSLDFDKYIGLDPIGTTGLATKVDHGYLMAFGAAAAIGGLGWPGADRQQRQCIHAFDRRSATASPSSPRQRANRS